MSLSCYAIKKSYFKIEYVNACKYHILSAFSMNIIKLLYILGTGITL